MFHFTAANFWNSLDFRVSAKSTDGATRRPASRDHFAPNQASPEAITSENRCNKVVLLLRRDGREVASYTVERHCFGCALALAQLMPEIVSARK
jgi:hypothetical protein